MRERKKIVTTVLAVLIILQHIKTVHEGERHHQCQMGDKSFGMYGSLTLRRHISNVHEGKKEQVSKICS